MSPIFEPNPKVLKEKKEKTQEEQKPRKKTAREPLQQLQQKVGNQAVQRLVVQRSGNGGFDLDDDTAGRIKEAQGGGETLGSELLTNMSQSFNQDFSGVRVHTSAESDTLNRELGAKAFTTGEDIFFRSGAYDPNSESGQQLIAHELTHVVQQGGSLSQPEAAFRVHPAGDSYEQEADAAARQVMQASAAGPVGGLQMQADEEEEEEPVQMQEEEEEEKDLVQLQAEEEEEVNQEEADEQNDTAEEADLEEEEENQ